MIITRGVSIYSLFKYSAGPTGGLIYHFTALRYRRSLWLPFLHSVNEWLTRDWNPQASEILIFGPSAGWSLSSEFLGRFKSILFIEPDITARLQLRRRFPQARFESRSDLLPWFEKLDTVDTSGSGFEALLAAHPTAAILFANVLGQVPLLVARENRNPYFMHDCETRFLRALEGRSWVSYHDRLSSRMPLRGSNINLDARASARELSSLVFDPRADASDSFRARTLEVIDHETDWLPTSRLAIWQIRPGCHHVVGFASS